MDTDDFWKGAVSMTSPIHVNSEIGKLKAVILKRPGHEVENITPEIMPRLLFDDIPYLPIAQKEHDQFAQVLRDHGAEVLYLENLTAEALDTDEGVKDRFLEQMLAESGYKSGFLHDAIKEYFLGMPTLDMVNKIMAGLRKEDIDFKPLTLEDMAENEDYPFLMDPMPNLYFTRDPAASIGDGLTINHMTFAVRQRESMFMEYIIGFHPRFADKGLSVWRDRYHDTRIEGGDEQVINDHTLAIGISQRTSADAIQDLAHSLFGHSNFDTILAVHIPHSHAMMHLDTVFTMVNYNQFTMDPEILDNGGKVDMYVLHPGKDGGIEITHKTDLEETLKRITGQSEIDIIYTGDGDPIVAAREQWNDGSNTLSIAPGEVVTYNRNYISNDMLASHGIKVNQIESSEISRGRGGPRCMSMPIVREDI
ncbi:MAG: arginine deiminase [Aeriscardovia sp.]|nr:arginine deiminase [Aeriscardovia sp.]